MYASAVFADPHGTWTVGTTLNYSMIAGSIGRAETLAFVWDDDGSGDIQVSQSVSNLDNISIQGLFCIGTGVSLQITNADTVNELLGESTSWGVNVGLSNKPSLNPRSTLNGSRRGGT